MKDLTPIPSINFPDFIIAKQVERDNKILTEPKQEQMDQIRKCIKEFKLKNNPNEVLLLWTTNTERYCFLWRT